MIDFADIVDIEKRTTAIFIPNAIQISTHQTKVKDHSVLQECKGTKDKEGMMACSLYMHY